MSLGLYPCSVWFGSGVSPDCCPGNEPVQLQLELQRSHDVRRHHECDGPRRCGRPAQRPWYVLWVAFYEPFILYFCESMFILPIAYIADAG